MNSRDIRTKINSIKNIKKITRALQMVSAVKMRKSQEKAQNCKYYQEAISKMLSEAICVSQDQINDLLQPQVNANNKNVYILISSNRGLCGSFNSGICRTLLKSCTLDCMECLTLGKKGAQIINACSGHVAADFSCHSPLTQVDAIFDFAMDVFKKGLCANVYLVYNKFISFSRSEVAVEGLLPLNFIQDKDVCKEQIEYTIEPDIKLFLHSIVRDYLANKIRMAIISSDAVEHSFRMLAMKKASDNASEIVQLLASQSNKIRQSKITSELLDLVSGQQSGD